MDIKYTRDTGSNAIIKALVTDSLGSTWKVTYQYLPGRWRFLGPIAGVINLGRRGRPRLVGGKVHDASGGPVQTYEYTRDGKGYVTGKRVVDSSGVELGTVTLSHDGEGRPMHVIVEGSATPVMWDPAVDR